MQCTLYKDGDNDVLVIQAMYDNQEVLKTIRKLQSYYTKADIIFYVDVFFSFNNDIIDNAISPITRW